MTAVPAVSPLVPKNRAGLGLGIGKSLLLTLPMALLGLLFLMGPNPPSDPLRLLANGATWISLTVIFFFLLRTGTTYALRATLFTVIAVAFSIGFIANLIEARGSMMLTEQTMASGETPFCHLVIPMVLIPAALTKTIIFPGSLVGQYGVASMFVLWIGASLALGRGWCSWVCFYGGLDEGFSRLSKNPRLKLKDPRWRTLPYAMLLAVVLLSAVSFSPVYCEWLCPFKTVTEFVEPTSFKIWVQTVIFLSLFAGAVVVLPILTRKRVQCGLACPFGAMQSFTNPVNVFDVRINPAQCSNCGKCTRECPTFSLDENSLKTGKPLLSCSKCGKCVDACPKGAINFHIKGTCPGSRPRLARALFLYPAFLLMLVIGGGMIADALWRLLTLLTTGSMI
jgi:ferredoxin-type protein NapH